MMHRDTEVRSISAEVGVGVFATRFIPRGTIVWVLDAFDRVLSPAQAARLPAMCRRVLDHYSYGDEAGNLVLCWDHARQVNHSCAASDWGVGNDLEIAVRDLHPGDELTSDYGVLNIRGTFVCRCGQPGCRGRVRADDAQRHWPEWDEQVAAAFPLAAGLEQPLVPFARHQETVADLLAGRVKAPSYRCLRAVSGAMPRSRVRRPMVPAAEPCMEDCR